MLTEHKINPTNDLIEIEPDARNPSNGNASHVYTVRFPEPKPGTPAMDPVHVIFQNGPINEVGINGLTNEALLAIVADRLRGFQSSAYACDENAAALAHIEEALQALHERTVKRMQRGVEGTHTV